MHDAEDTIELLLPSVVGFYMPGHQFKGKKHVLNTAADMTTMYALHPQKRTNPPTIYIFAEVRLGKEAVAACRRHGTGQTSSAAATLMADKVEVYEHLKEKHGDRGFSDEQIHMSGYLVATKRHDSQEHPPAKRFFGKSASTKNKRRQEDSDGEDAPAVDVASSSRAAENAPGRENERDKIMCQLRELCHLCDIGGVKEEEFTRERAKLAKILSTAE